VNSAVEFTYFTHHISLLQPLEAEQGVILSADGCSRVFNARSEVVTDDKAIQRGQVVEKYPQHALSLSSVEASGNVLSPVSAGAVLSKKSTKKEKVRVYMSREEVCVCMYVVSLCLFVSLFVSLLCLCLCVCVCVCVCVCGCVRMGAHSCRYVYIRVWVCTSASLWDPCTPV
jgi:hypothetical protein